MRTTAAVAGVLRVFLDNVGEARYGYELMRSTDYPSGKLYPILARLQKCGWLEQQLDVSGRSLGPARRHYRLTAEGVRSARILLAQLDRQRSA